MTKNCVMCGKEFEEKDLDFLGRCEPCFKKFMETPEDKRPKIGIPFSPIYNGGR
jgi:DNA-directed RNA polymerase subunit RPC12/RpoP